MVKVGLERLGKRGGRLEALGQQLRVTGMESSPLYYNPQLAPTERTHPRHTGVGDCAGENKKKQSQTLAHKGRTTYGFSDNSPSKATILQFSASKAL